MLRNTSTVFQVPLTAIWSFLFPISVLLMSVSRSTALLLLIALLIAGCGGGQAAFQDYDADSGQTTYRTRAYTVSTLSGANIGSSKSISLRARGQCTGRGCTPSTLQLIFSASGNQELQMSGLDGRIVADDARITWSSREAAQGQAGLTNDRVITAIGQFAAIDVSLQQAEQVAAAGSVEGVIGGRSLRIGEGVQTGLQTLLRKIKGTPARSKAGTREER